MKKGDCVVGKWVCLRWEAFAALAFLIAARTNAQCSGNTDLSIDSPAAAFQRVVLYTQKVERAVQTREQAAARALAYFGLDRSAEFDSDLDTGRVSQVRLSDDTTPFISKEIDGKLVWKVEINDVRFSVRRDSLGHETVAVRGFDVFVDSGGTLMKIIAERPSFDETVWRKPAAAVAERQLRGHREEYLGLVAAAPETDFVSALCAATRFHPQVLSAEQIVGVCVTFQYQGATPYPVWDIHVYGAPNILKYDPARPFYHTDHSRILVNAETSKVLWQDNLPHPTDD